jgi:hypothetical protein
VPILVQGISRGNEKELEMRMIKKTKTTETTVEKSELFVLRKPSRIVLAWCARCGAEVRMFTPEEAAVTKRVSTRTIYAFVEDGRIHFTEKADGLLLVCLNSFPEMETKG